jgi:hypothetical protein
MARGLIIKREKGIEITKRRSALEAPTFKVFTRCEPFRFPGGTFCRRVAR